MLNLTLYRREMKNSLKMLLIFAAVMTLYIAVIIGMYDPKMTETLDNFYEMMPDLMASVGMKAGTNTLVGFMVSYLYGFILIVFPMVFCILRGNGLIAKYVDHGSMVTLMAAPVKRRTIVRTQMAVLLSGIFLLVLYATGLELAVCRAGFPEEPVTAELLKLNAALLCLHLFNGGICFLASCVFSDTKRSIAFGAGFPALMYVVQMLANVGGKAEQLKYVTYFTLFNPDGILAGETCAFVGAAVLLAGAAVLFALAEQVFCRKDLHI